MITPGFVVLCDTDATILEICRDDVGISQHVKPGDAFISLVDVDSAGKAIAFFARLRSEKACFEWELTVKTDYGLEVMPVGGYISPHGYHILGARSYLGISAKLCEEVMRINSEQINSLRQAFKQISRCEHRHHDRDHQIYEEFSRLNSELITVRRKLTKQNQKLELLNEEKIKFLGMAAHDLRNPLGVIREYSNLLIEDLGRVLHPNYLHLLQAIEHSSHFMLQMVEDLLEFAQMGTGRLKLHCALNNLYQLIEKSVQRNSVMANRKEITLTLQSDPSLPLLPIDSGKIEQVMNNLLSNAIKYSPRQSHIEVTVTNTRSEIIVSVRDQGPGIPESEQDRLFQPFQTTSVSAANGEKGTGLGLVIVKKIIEGHGGKICLESKVGDGSCFFFSLPVLLPAAAGDIGRENPLEKLTTAIAKLPMKILLVEDDICNQQLTEEIINRCGYSFELATSGKQALALYQQQAFDLVLLDMSLSGMEGTEVAARIRGYQKNYEKRVPIVALTVAKNESDYEEDDLESEIDLVIARPITADRLQAVVAQLVCGDNIEAPAGGESVFDEHRLLNAVEYDDYLLDKLISTFTDQAAKRLQDIHRGIDHHDWKQLRQIAHTYKGSLKIFAAERALAVVNDFEAACITEDIDATRNYYQCLQQEITSLVETVQKFWRRRRNISV